MRGVLAPALLTWAIYIMFCDVNEAVTRAGLGDDDDVAGLIDFQARAWVAPPVWASCSIEHTPHVLRIISDLLLD